MSGTWDYIILEGYCLINIKYAMKGSKFNYLLESDGTFKPVKNERYKKGTKKDKTPEFCEKREHPCFNCIEHKCKHFSFTPADKNLIIIDPSAIKEEFEGIVE